MKHGTFAMPLTDYVRVFEELWIERMEDLKSKR